MVREDCETTTGTGGDAAGGGDLVSVNGNELAVETSCGGNGNSSRLMLVDGLRTYKRRKCTEGVQDEKASGRATANEVSEKKSKESFDASSNKGSAVLSSAAEMNPPSLWNCSDVSSIELSRNVILQQIRESLGNEGGLCGFIQDALTSHSKSGCTTAAKDSVCSPEVRNKSICESQSGSRSESKGKVAAISAEGKVNAISNGSVDVPSNQTIMELCQRFFLAIITSEKFSQLCNVLSQNFPGMKVDRIFDISLINSRMEEGAYESSPLLFYSDIQQAWTKLQKVGAEIVSLSKCLSDQSRAFYCAQVGGHIPSSSADGNLEIPMRGSDTHFKPESMDGCAAYKVFTWGHCGEKPNGQDILVCDSCEGTYHVSCIEPVVKDNPQTSWLCVSCAANRNPSSHDNCAVCERLNAPESFDGGHSYDERANEVAHQEWKDKSNVLMEEEFRLYNGGKDLPVCNVCRTEVEARNKFKICGHPFCPHKFYHEKCLTSKELNTYGRCWYCPSCLCRACLIDRDDDSIVLCDSCDLAYHTYCMQPPRDSIPKGKWFCNKCDAELQRMRKARRKYEDLQNRGKKGAVDYQGSHGYLSRGQKRREEALDKSGGVDMLLTAAKTLNYEENLAAMASKA